MAPDASQDELLNGAVCAMAAQLGLLGGQSQQQQQQSMAQQPLEAFSQFWQAIQLGLVQAMSAATAAEKDGHDGIMDTHYGTYGCSPTLIT
jgi:hypothetical protein